MKGEREMLTASLVLIDEVVECEARKYEHDDLHWVVIKSGGLTVQIKEDRLRPFINQLEAAEAEINRKAMEHIEEIRLHRHATAGQDGEHQGPEGPGERIPHGRAQSYEPGNDRMHDPVAG